MAEMAGQLPGNTAAAVPSIRTDPLLKVAATILKDPRVMAEDATTPQNTDLWRVFVEHVQAALQGRMSTQQAMDDAAKAWDEILARYR